MVSTSKLQHHSLPRFAGRVAAFVLPILVVLLLLELGVRRVGTLHRSRARELERGESAAAVLVTGNSRETVGVICKELGRPCAKLAAGSQSLLLDAALLRRYDAAFPSVRVLLIGVSYYSFKYALEDEESWRQFEYFHAYDVDGERAPLPRTDIRRYSLAATYGIQTSLKWGLQGFPRLLPAAKADVVGDVDVSALVQRERSNSALQRRLAKHERSLRPALVPETTAAVASMIAWAKQHDAVPVLLMMPLTRAYHDAADAKEMAFARETLAGLGREHGARIADYMSDARFGDDDFYDFDHLNRQGALRFTAILKTEVIEPLLGAP